MILGVGNDMVDIRRIEALLERFGSRFERKIFSPREQAQAARASGIRAAATYAKRFAAKEAFAKAIGRGIGTIQWREIEVSNLPSGQPELRLSGEAHKALLAMTPPKMRAAVHISLSDEYPYAQAFVVISAVAA